MSVLAHEIHQQVVFMPFCSIYFLCADHFLVFFIVLFVLFCLRILFVCCDWFWYFAVSTFSVKWLKGIVCDESPCLTFSGLTRSAVFCAFKTGDSLSLEQCGCVFDFSSLQKKIGPLSFRLIVVFLGVLDDDDDDDDDCFYIALFSALEQARCARMWFYMSD